MTVAYPRALSLEVKAVDGKLVGRSFSTPAMLFVAFMVLAGGKDRRFRENTMGESASWEGY